MREHCCDIEARAGYEFAFVAVANHERYGLLGGDYEVNEATLAAGFHFVTFLASMRGAIGVLELQIVEDVERNEAYVKMSGYAE